MDKVLLDNNTSNVYDAAMAANRGRASDQLRKIIEGSGMSRYAICKSIKLDQAQMSKFMAGQGGLSMECLDRLADLLKLRITTGKRPANRKTGDR